MPKLAPWLVVALVGGAFALGLAGGGLLVHSGSSRKSNSGSHTTPTPGASSRAPGNLAAGSKGAPTSPGALHKPVASGLVAAARSSVRATTHATAGRANAGTNSKPTTKNPSPGQKTATIRPKVAPKPATTGRPGAGTTSTPTTTTGGGGASSNPGEPAAVAACKQDVQTVPTTSASAKVHLERVCEKAASTPSGDTAAAGEVLEELQAALSH